MLNNYFIPFIPDAKVNYFYLLQLYDAAEYNPITGLYDTIKYQSVAKLAGQLGLSQKVVNTILTKQDYTGFLYVNKEDKKIIILNSFKKGTNTRPFVHLTINEVSFLRQQRSNGKDPDNTLFKYFLYMKYYCLHCRKQVQDFTANQFLTACGYSLKSNSMKDQICKYNNLLYDKGYIDIEKYRDDLGHTRNRYIFIEEVQSLQSFSSL